MLFILRSRRGLLLASAAFFLLTLALLGGGTHYGRGVVKSSLNKVGLGDHADEPRPAPTPKYKPTPTYTPPPVTDPFPALLTMATPPPIPKWNEPRKKVHETYGLDQAPPLFIGFTRTWPILLQAVVSYITAGWPPSQIYVVENTGVQMANARGQLSLQNPFYLNHTSLKKLGVNVIQTPTLLSFAQLQNFFINQAHVHDWKYYFWSHMDVLALSYEEGQEGLTPPYDKPGYKSVYELALTHLNETIKADPKWAVRFFAYDHLALVNRDAYDGLGGWDTLIPYYITDCDFHNRITMGGYTMGDVRAGIITDVATALNDLMALYRDPSVKPAFTDPNPPPPPPPEEEKPQRRWWPVSKRTPAAAAVAAEEAEDYVPGPIKREVTPASATDPMDYFRALVRISNDMFHYKHGARGRNTWQQGQRGGFGEPFYYPAHGLAEAIEVITDAGREVFRRKWGHRDCDLQGGAGLKLWDQWLVEKDWD